MRNVRDYAIITGTYWAFTLSDGALRMLVLLHLHDQGYSPLSLAVVFVLYEVFGMVTNLFGGWLGARRGLKLTLGAGLLLQVLACGLLAAAAGALTVPFVVAMQGLSGIAKDLTKMSSKSYIKKVVPSTDQVGLLKWVALLTGSKNTLKGVGYFLGGFLLATVDFQGACLAMAIALALTWVASMLALPRAPGKSGPALSLKSLMPQDARLKWLSVARLFLFGSRDAWFTVGLPIFLSASLGWSFEAVGGFLAGWIIGYGVVQALAPTLLGKSKQDDRATLSTDAAQLGGWKLALLLPLTVIVIGLHLGWSPTAVILAGLIVFAIIFAMNSALHSYLVVAYAEEDTVALSVGFYYMSNAAGRLLGTILSGWVYQAWGLEACLWISSGLVAMAALLSVLLPQRRPVTA